MDAIPFCLLDPESLLYADPDNPPIRWIKNVIRRRIPWNFLRRYGRDFYEQEGWLTVWLAALSYNPDEHAGVEFPAYATFCLHRRMRRLRLEQYRDRFQVQWPKSDSHPFEPSVPSPRFDEDISLLALWCEREYRTRRMILSWKQRVVLYLATVEGWNYRELARYFGQTHQNMHHCVSDARFLLGAAPAPGKLRLPQPIG